MSKRAIAEFTILYNNEADTHGVIERAMNINYDKEDEDELYELFPPELSESLILKRSESETLDFQVKIGVVIIAMIYLLLKITDVIE